MERFRVLYDNNQYLSTGTFVVPTKPSWTPPTGVCFSIFQSDIAYIGSLPGGVIEPGGGPEEFIMVITGIIVVPSFGDAYTVRSSVSVGEGEQLAGMFE